MKVAIDPFERAVNLKFAGDGVNLGDGCEPRIPDRLCVVTTEAIHQVRQPLVRHHRQVRAGVTGIDLRAPIPFDQRDRLASPREEIRGGQSGDAPADDHHVHALIALDPREPGESD